MGSYLNPGNKKFVMDTNAKIYVDKTGLIEYCNDVINTSQRYICVSRPRRFGKSVTANMLAAYYSRSCDSGMMFSQFQIAGTKSFPEHLNQYHVIFLNMQEFLSESSSMSDMLQLIRKSVLWDLLEEYPDIRYFDSENLTRTMQDIYKNTGISFVIIIDEWDCVFREYKVDANSQKIYLDFLRDFLKDKVYIALGYMTGILPIKKYGSHSALNMFDEFSMIFPGPLAKYMGFTESEVRKLCSAYHMDFEDVKRWYDGYNMRNGESIYNPRSVVNAMQFGICDTYWNQTETFEALRIYIDMNFDGLKDNIIEMMGGKRIPVNTGSFTNDMTTFHVKDDVLTLLVHLGYLSYDYTEKQVYIPNWEVLNEYANAVRVSDWGQVSKALAASRTTLEAIWRQDEQKVAAAIQEAHFETSHLQYNDENALSYTVSIALYTARDFYTIHREQPSGKGFADMVFIPRKNHPEKPALIIELKWDKNAQGAIEQIRKKNYCQCLEEYQGNLLLVGINYDRLSRIHQCIIEKYRKD